MRTTARSRPVWQRRPAAGLVAGSSGWAVAFRRERFRGDQTLSRKCLPSAAGRRCHILLLPRLQQRARVDEAGCSSKKRRHPDRSLASCTYHRSIHARRARRSGRTSNSGLGILRSALDFGVRIGNQDARGSSPVKLRSKSRSPILSRGVRDAGARIVRKKNTIDAKAAIRGPSTASARGGRRRSDEDRWLADSGQDDTVFSTASAL